MISGDRPNPPEGPAWQILLSGRFLPGCRMHGGPGHHRAFPVVFCRSRDNYFTRERRRTGASVMLNEFREFISRGNVIDLAVGIIIGAAFTAIVNSLVNDLIMPPIGYIMGGIDFSSYYLNLTGGEYASLAAAKEAGAATINYGAFINAVINFLIIAFAVFLIVKQVNRFRRTAPPPAPSTKDCPRCATAIPLKATRCPHCTSELAAA
jgi:large conductance mechanosensitive channel